MRLSELLAAEVFDVDGTNLGKVHDVRLVQDGPYLEAFGAALRIDGLVLGRGAVSLRLGFHRANVKGPWPLRNILRSMEARAIFVPWEAVASLDDEAIRLGRRVDDLPRLADIA